MLVFRKIWHALFSCDTRFEIRPLPYYRQLLLIKHRFNFDPKYISIKLPFMVPPLKN